MKTEKPCSKCKVIKPIDAFCHKADRKDGRNSHCRACDSKQKKAKKKPQIPVKQGSKECATCKIEKPYADFSRNASRSDMSNYECKACEKERRAERKGNDIDYASFYLPVNYY